MNPESQPHHTEPAPRLSSLRTRLLKVGAWLLGGAIVAFGVLAVVIYLSRDTLFQQVQTYFNRQIDGELLVGSHHVAVQPDPAGGWVPGLVLVLRDVHLRDADFARHRVELLTAREMRLRVGFWRLLAPDVRLRNIALADATIRAFIDAGGRSNLSLNRPDSARKASGRGLPTDFLNYLGRAHLENVRVSFKDYSKQKWYAANFRDVYFELTDDGPAHDIRLAGRVDFTGLAFNAAQGPYAGNLPTVLDLLVRYDTDTRRLTVAPSLLRTTTDTVRISGHFDFPKDSVPRLDLRFQAQNLPLRRGLALVTPHLRRVIGKFDAFPVVRDLDVRLRGNAGRGQPPAVDVTFDLDTFRFQTHLGLLTDLRAHGTFTNHVNPKLPNWDANSRVLFTNVRGRWEGVVPVNGRFLVQNLTDPIGDLVCHAYSPLAALNDLIGGPSYRFGAGNATADLRFRGDLNQTYDSTTGRLRGTLAGTVRVENGTFEYLPRRVRLSAIGGTAHFNERDAWINDFRATANGSPLHVDGLIRQLGPFILAPRQRVYAEAHLRSDDFELNTSRYQPVATRRPRRPRVALTIDEVIDRLDARLTLDVKKFRFQKFRAENLRGNLNLTNEALSIRSITMNAFGGTFQFRGEVDYLNQYPSRLRTWCSVQNAEVGGVFRAFGNFGQTTLTARNLRGRWSSEGTFQSDLDRDYGLLPATMHGDMHVRLRDGELLDFEPLKRIQKVILKNRNFDRIRFATIANRFRLRGQELYIDRMEIESSALTLYVGGRYSFADRTNLRIQVPLLNLRRRDSTYQLTRRDPTKLASVFLTAVDEGDGVKIKLGKRDDKPVTPADSTGKTGAVAAGPEKK
jgi:hypothetical protein